MYFCLSVCLPVWLAICLSVSIFLSEYVIMGVPVSTFKKKNVLMSGRGEGHVERVRYSWRESEKGAVWWIGNHGYSWLRFELRESEKTGGGLKRQWSPARQTENRDQRVNMSVLQVNRSSDWEVNAVFPPPLDTAATHEERKIGGRGREQKESDLERDGDRQRPLKCWWWQQFDNSEADANSNYFQFLDGLRSTPH